MLIVTHALHGGGTLVLKADDHTMIAVAARKPPRQTAFAAPHSRSPGVHTS